jgi:signal transduction histidine kinase
MGGAIIGFMFSRLRRATAEHPRILDALVAVVLALLLGLGFGLHGRGGDSSSQIIGGVLAAIVALPVAVRRRHPYVSLAGSLVLTVVVFAFSDPAPPVILPTAIALYTIGTTGTRRTVLLVGSGTLVVSLALGLGYTDNPAVVELIVRDVAWVVGSLAVGFAVANRRAYVGQIRQRAIEAERTKEEEAQRRVEEERIRIARDVHDGVAHALASISIQAGAGGAVLDSDPEGARQAFKAIRAASALALFELRSTLGLLRHDSEGPLAGGFQPERVDRLAEVLRAEGIRVSVHGQACSQPVEGDVGTAIHRILQEALTNVLRHSRARAVNITLDRIGDDVVLRVTDDGRESAQEPGANPGYGLLGMRERAVSVGGSLEYGPVSGGGFSVKAVLPMKGSS